MEHLYTEELEFSKTHRSVFRFCCDTLQNCRLRVNWGSAFCETTRNKSAYTLSFFPLNMFKQFFIQGNVIAHFLLLNTLSVIPYYSSLWDIMATDIIIEITRKGEDVENGDTCHNCLNMNVINKSTFWYKKVQNSIWNNKKLFSWVQLVHN